jgi:hypothetical protein
MKNTFMIPVTLTICCATCDHRDKRSTEEKRTLKERLTNSDTTYLNFFDKTRTEYGADYCELLNADIANVSSEEPKDMPCHSEQWQDTEQYYELDFSVKFKDRLTVTQQQKTEAESP